MFIIVSEASFGTGITCKLTPYCYNINLFTFLYCKHSFKTLNSLSYNIILIPFIAVFLSICLPSWLSFGSVDYFVTLKSAVVFCFPFLVTVCVFIQPCYCLFKLIMLIFFFSILFCLPRLMMVLYYLTKHPYTWQPLGMQSTKMTRLNVRQLTFGIYEADYCFSIHCYFWVVQEPVSSTSTSVVGIGNAKFFPSITWWCIVISLFLRFPRDFHFPVWNSVYGFDMSCIKKQALMEPLVDTVDQNQIVTNCQLLKVEILTQTNILIKYYISFCGIFGLLSLLLFDWPLCSVTLLFG